MIVGRLVAFFPSDMLVYFKDGSVQTIARSATLTEKLHVLPH